MRAHCGRSHCSHRSERASALVAVLWCAVILSTIVFSTLTISRTDVRIATGYGDQVRARYIALAGIEYAKAVIHSDRAASENGGVFFDDTVFDDPDRFREIQCGPGYFSILRSPRRGESSFDDFIYGVLDEERFLSVNHAQPNEIAKLPDLDPEIGASIVDWRDADDRVQNGGAEGDYYSSLSPPYAISDHSITTVRELLMVRGITPDGLLGEDLNADGIVNPSERDGDRTYPSDNQDGVLDGGWARYITLESRIPNVDRYGEPRILLGSALEEDLAALPGVGAELAASIILWRDQQSLDGVLGLLDVQTMNEVSGENGESSWQPTGENLIDQSLLLQFADYLTDSAEPDRLGAININTAPFEVLACLPGLDEVKARAIVDHRAAFGFFESAVGLLDVDGLDRNIVKGLLPRVDVRSSTYRICAEGHVPSSGARKRILVTVRFGEFEVETLSFREDL